MAIYRSWDLLIILLPVKFHCLVFKIIIFKKLIILPVSMNIPLKIPLDLIIYPERYF